SGAHRPRIIMMVVVNGTRLCEPFQLRLGMLIDLHVHFVWQLCRCQGTFFYGFEEGLIRIGTDVCNLGKFLGPGNHPLIPAQRQSLTALPQNTAPILYKVFVLEDWPAVGAE